ncbi:NmrA family NAD(P)-binding protein [Alteromonas gracilis]
MIAVTGANGQLGQKVIDALLVSRAPRDIVALVRNPDNASSLREKGL